MSDGTETPDYNSQTRDLLLLVLPITMEFLDGDLLGAAGTATVLVTGLPPWLLNPR